MLLSLDRTPALDVIGGTVIAWCQTLWPEKAWDEEHDTQRILQGFHQLCRHCEQWPSPKRFLELMPARVIVNKRLTNVASDETRAKGMAEIEDIIGAKFNSNRTH